MITLQLLLLFVICILKLCQFTTKPMETPGRGGGSRETYTLNKKQNKKKESKMSYVFSLMEQLCQ